uniref:SMC hinge domain-containing protein n=1 Tax=Bursaphelenchus xylophilus TaxID=6326 RepID=A0A1I7SIJ2_BURXY
ISSVIVRYKNTAKNLLKSGQLERRVVFIPLDDIQSRTVGDRQYQRAVQLVGEGHVYRAIDLVEFSPDIRKAVEFALGSMLICTDMNRAREVCFDHQVHTRVVTLDGEDFRPDGVLSGGGTGNKGRCLRALNECFEGNRRIREIEHELRSITGELE